MRKLDRRPVSLYNNVMEYGLEMLRVHQLPTDDLYSFKIVAQLNDDWYVLLVDDIQRIQERWRQRITWRSEVDLDGINTVVNCLGVMNERNEVIIWENKCVHVTDFDKLKSVSVDSRVDLDAARIHSYG